MGRLIEFEVPGSETLLVETQENGTSGPQPLGVEAETIEKATMSLDTAIAKIRPMANILLAELKGLEQRPEEVAIEFGVKLSASAGILIANTAVEGNCKITLKWSRTAGT
jgi:hypothetical protein